MLGSEVKVPCGICVGEKQEAKYTCSRCKEPYCSLKCFKSVKHQQCSESFYEKNVREAIPSGNDKDKLKLIGVLDKYGSGGSEGSDGWKYEVPVDYNKIEEGLQLTRRDLEDGDDDDDRSLTMEEELELQKLVEEATPEQLLKLMTPDEKLRFEEMLKSSGYDVTYD